MITESLLYGSGGAQKKLGLHGDFLTEKCNFYTRKAAVLRFWAYVYGQRTMFILGLLESA